MRARFAEAEGQLFLSPERRRPRPRCVLSRAVGATGGHAAPPLRPQRRPSPLRRPSRRERAARPGPTSTRSRTSSPIGPRRAASLRRDVRPRDRMLLPDRERGLRIPRRPHDVRSDSASRPDRVRHPLGRGEDDGPFHGAARSVVSTCASSEAPDLRPIIARAEEYAPHDWSGAPGGAANDTLFVHPRRSPVCSSASAATSVGWQLVRPPRAGPSAVARPSTPLVCDGARRARLRHRRRLLYLFRCNPVHVELGSHSSAIVPPLFRELRALAAQLLVELAARRRRALPRHPPHALGRERPQPDRPLEAVPLARLTELDIDPRFRIRARDLLDRFAARSADDAGGGRRPSRRGSRPERPVAYFSAEFAIHESLPIYAGGLGVLAGDHLKSASDVGVPLDRHRPPLPSGVLPPGDGPLVLAERALRRPRHRRRCRSSACTAATAQALGVAISVARRTVHVSVWCVRVGRVAALPPRHQPRRQRGARPLDHGPPLRRQSGHAHGAGADARHRRRARAARPRHPPRCST